MYVGIPAEGAWASQKGIVVFIANVQLEHAAQIRAFYICTSLMFITYIICFYLFNKYKKLYININLCKHL